MCGVVGVLPSEGAETRGTLGLAIELLEGSRNRGEDGTGLLLYGRGLFPGLFHLEKWLGSAHQIPERLYRLNLSHRPQVLLGHTRYATRGVISHENIHPVWASLSEGGRERHLFLVMNGEVSFTERWLRRAEERGINLHGATTDTAGCAGMMLQLYLDGRPWGEALAEFYKQAFPFGGFTILGLLIDGEEAAFFYVRDGMRPLHSARLEGLTAFVSETKPLTRLGLKYEEIEAVKPGSIGVYSLQTESWQRLDMNERLRGRASRGECSFEYAYFQEPNSVMHGRSMDEVRAELGKAACREHPPPEGHGGGRPRTIVTAIPKSGISAAYGYAEQALRGGHDVHLGAIVLRRSGSDTRSFLGEGRPEIARRLQKKFEVNAQEARGAVIINVDDSIVRGNVSAWIGKMEREAGAREVRFVSAWPPIIGPCYAGIAIDVGEPLAELVAEFNPMELASDHRPLEERLEAGYEHETFGETGFDQVSYLSSEAVERVLAGINPGDFCTGCFSGVYNYINPLNIRGTPYRYKEWLDRFIELNGVEMPEPDFQKRPGTKMGGSVE